MAETKIRLFLAEDHNVVREGLASLLAQEPDMEVIGEASTGREAVEKVPELKPDVVTMDIGMRELNGIDATRQIMREGIKCRVICLSVHREMDLVHAMLEAGACGYLLKTSAAKQLVEAVRTVARGETYLSPPIARDVVDHHLSGAEDGGSCFAVLSHREREVLQLIAQGLHTKSIATRLHISPRTVLAHRENIMNKLNLDSVVALTRYAIREGISDL